MINRRAFTLIELLVTATIMVAVSFLTLSIFSTVARVQADRRTTQTTINQSGTLLDQLAGELESLNRSMDASNARVRTFALGSADDYWAIAMNVPRLDERGLPLTTNLVRVYCRSIFSAPAQAGVYGRVSVFTTTSPYALTNIPLSTPSGCSEAEIESAAGGIQFTQTNLTDDFTNVRYFGVYDVSSRVPNAVPPTTDDNMALRVVLSAGYDERMKYADVPSVDPASVVTISRTISRAQP